MDLKTRKLDIDGFKIPADGLTVETLKKLLSNRNYGGVGKPWS